MLAACNTPATVSGAGCCTLAVCRCYLGKSLRRFSLLSPLTHGRLALASETQRASCSLAGTAWRT